MKKVFVMTIIAGVVFACSRKTTPTSEIIISNQEKQTEKKDVAVVNTGTMETNAGKTVYTTKCNRCHALKPVEKYTAQEWDNILKSMIPKAKLSESESIQVTTYVKDNAKK